MRDLVLRLRRFTGWVWFIGGVVTVGVGVVFAILTAAFIHQTEETGGRVLNLIPVTDEENHTVSYATVFTFTASDGRSYTITSNTSTNPPSSPKAKPFASSTIRETLPMPA
jgi:hypothetical protein